MKSPLALLLPALLAFTGAAPAADTKPAPAPARMTDKQKLSYSVGVVFARNLALETEVDIDTFVQGIRDVMEKKDLRMTVEQMQAVLEQYRQEQMKAQAGQADKNLAAGQKFLAENKTKPGVVETASGLQYKVVKTGTGKKPAVSNTVVAHYKGTLVDGTEFDSSYARGEPATFPLANVIKGWQEGLALMPAGSTYELYIPAQLAYGNQQKGPVIGPNSTLVFTVELIEVK